MVSCVDRKTLIFQNHQHILDFCAGWEISLHDRIPALLRRIANGFDSGYPRIAGDGGRIQRMTKSGSALIHGQDIAIAPQPQLGVIRHKEEDSEPSGPNSQEIARFHIDFPFSDSATRQP